MPASAKLKTGLKKVNLLSPPSNTVSKLSSENGMGISSQLGKSTVNSGKENISTTFP